MRHRSNTKSEGFVRIENKLEIWRFLGSEENGGAYFTEKRLRNFDGEVDEHFVPNVQNRLIEDSR